MFGRNWWVGCLLLCLWASALPLRAADFTIGETRKGVVYIKTLTPGLPAMEGSGFLVSKDGLIFTNRHVVQGDGKAAGGIVLVGVPSPKDPEVLDYFRAEPVLVTKPDDAPDFAVLKIAPGPKYGELVPLKLNYGRVELGQAVAVMGYPHVVSDQPSLSFNKGTVSTALRKIDEYSYCQIDAAVNPGNSGGPLLLPSGEAVGIVTAKKMDAENIGFALYLKDVQQLVQQATTAERLAQIRPEPGPLDPAKLPKPSGIAPLAENWEAGTTATRIKADKNKLVVEAQGDDYWLVSKRDLPKNFQITIPCWVEFYQGMMHIQISQKNILRSFAFRFATDDTKSGILESRGYLIQYSSRGAWLFKENPQGRKSVVTEWTGNPEGPMIFTVTYKDGEITAAANQTKLLSYKDPQPLSAQHKFCIGGFLSRLTLGEVLIVDLDAAGGPASTAPANTATAPSK